MELAIGLMCALNLARYPSSVSTLPGARSHVEKMSQPVSPSQSSKNAQWMSSDLPFKGPLTNTLTCVSNFFHDETLAFAQLNLGTGEPVRSAMLCAENT